MHFKPDLSAAGLAVVELVERLHGSAGRMQSQNNLKQLALATINYADTFGHLPAQAVFGQDGKPQLSWRVMILPYIEQDALYKEFHLDEPWDSEHNKKLLARMPKTFAMPGSPKGTTDTSYLGFVGKGAFFEGKKGLKFPAEFSDGTSNTIMFVEAAKGVPWTKPEDLPFDPDKELPKLGGHFPGGFNVGMCDGSVRFISNKISKETLKAAITRNGGEVLGPDF
jgi:prepilin-type processing-associated H-X9-DG protein